MARAHIAVLAAASLALPTGARADASPFAGTWKLNAEKSRLAHGSIKFEAARRGKTRAVVAHQAYTFRPDGKNYHGPFRYTVAWTKVDDRRWRVLWKLKNTLVATEILEIAPGGKTLTSTTTRSRADGSSYSESVVYERAAGAGDGLLGTWRSTGVAVTCFTTIDVAGFTTVDIAPFENGLTLTLIEPSARASVTIDGRDHPLEGPKTPPGMSLSLRPHGERTLAIVEKQDLIPIYVGTLSVSDDSRTLTWTWKPALVDEPISAVFDRM